MVQSQNLKRRIEKIEQKLGVSDKGPCFRFPDGKGGFIEVPGCRSLVDVIALAGIRKHEQEMDETGRN